MDTLEVFPVDAEAQDFSLGLSTLLPPGPVLVTSADNDSWAERNGLTLGAEIIAIGTKGRTVCDLPEDVFLEAVRDRPLYMDVRLASMQQAEEVGMLLAQNLRKQRRLPPARPVYPFIVGDSVDGLTFSVPEPLELGFSNKLPLSSSAGAPRMKSPASRSIKAEAGSNMDIEDALRYAHLHAIAEANRYWKCEMAISQTRMKTHMIRVEASELRESLTSEPREAAAELMQATEMQDEARAMAKQVKESELRLAEFQATADKRASDARHVAQFFTRAQEKVDQARDFTQKLADTAKADQELAALRQQQALEELHKTKAIFDMYSHVETETQQMKFLLKSEQDECDMSLEHGECLRRELEDLRSQNPPAQDAKAERDLLLRELRALNKMSRSGQTPPRSLSASQKSNTKRPKTPPPLVRRSALAAQLEQAGFDGANRMLKDSSQNAWQTSSPSGSLASSVGSPVAWDAGDTIDPRPGSGRNSRLNRKIGSDTRGRQPEDDVKSNASTYSATESELSQLRTSLYNSVGEHF